MARPRPVLPQTTQLITRATTQREFLLKPSRFVRLILTFCIAYAAWKYSVQIHAVAVLSNHFHMVCTDVEGRMPQFMHWLNLHVAKILNRRYGRKQNFFDNRQHQPQILADELAVRRAIRYVMLQPVDAGITPESRLWDGLITRLADLAGTPRKVSRPKFFRKDGPVAPLATLRHTIPPHFAHLGRAAWRDLVAEDVAKGEAEIQAERAAEGLDFQGMRRAAALPHTTRPKKPLAPGIRPQVIASTREVRDKILARLRAFREAYAESFARWRAGDRACRFPAGTWALRVYHGALCHDVPCDGLPPPT